MSSNVSARIDAASSRRRSWSARRSSSLSVAGAVALAEKVPDEIREDVETVAAAYSQYIDVIQDVGIEPGEIPTAEQAQQLQDALQNVGEADVTAAGERLSVWTTENCTG